MASVYRAPNARSKTSYIATMAYPSNIFQYTQSQDANFVTQGYLSSLKDLTTGTASNCSKGRVLVETGERLFPGQPGISTFMVKVTDLNSKLSGYIDPNCQAFAQYNDNRPVETIDGYDTSGNVTHRGAGIFTLGNIAIQGKLDVSGGILSAGFVGQTSIEVGISAAGTNQATAYALTKQINKLSTVSAGQGVVLPTGTVGMRITIANGAATTVNVYPAGSGTINGGSGGAAVTLAGTTTKDYICTAANTWFSL